MQRHALSSSLMPLQAAALRTHTRQARLTKGHNQDRSLSRAPRNCSTRHSMSSLSSTMRCALLVPCSQRCSGGPNSNPSNSKAPPSPEEEEASRFPLELEELASSRCALLSIGFKQGITTTAL